jgi:hypothetical protein
MALRKHRGYSTSKCTWTGTHLGSAEPRVWPTLGEPPQALPSSSWLAGGLWCCFLVIRALARPFGMPNGPLNPCACLWLVGGVFHGLLGSFASGCGPSNSRARIECSEIYFFLCLSMVFLYMQTWSPVNSDSPKLVEMVRSLNFDDYLSLNEVEVDGRTCNLMTVNNTPTLSPLLVLK